MPHSVQPPATFSAQLCWPRKITGCQTPNTLKTWFNVEIRPSVGIPRVVEVRVAEVRTGIRIHAVRPRVLRVQREGVRELVPEAGNHHVAVGFSLAAESIDAVDKRIQRRSQNRSIGVCVVVVQQVMAQSCPYIPHPPPRHDPGRYPSPANSGATYWVGKLFGRPPRFAPPAVGSPALLKVVIVCGLTG